MKQLVIKGHAIRGKEIIDLLEMLGAHRLGYNDTFTEFYYYIEDGAICSSEKCPRYAIVFTLEEFIQKYPYKIGDKVIYTKFGDNYPVIIESMEWTGTTIEYTFNGCVTCLAKDLKFNKEIDINNEVKPIFKVGDEIEKADGLTNSCIVTGVTSKYYSLSGVGVLPVNKQDEYILVNRAEDKEPEPKAPILSNRYDYAEGKCGYVIPDGYEFDTVIDNKIVLKKLKPKYPKTYEECCKILNLPFRDFDILYNILDTTEIIYNKNLDILLNSFRKLLVCRDAYWKIAGEQMGLDEPWKPDWKDKEQIKFVIVIQKENILRFECIFENKILAFPTEEMRDAFYKNFKDLIEQCKELL